MKIACEKCLKVEDANNLKDWIRVRTDQSEFWLCPHCAEGFWMAVDHNLPPVISDKPKKGMHVIKKLFAPESEIDAACKWVTKTTAPSEWPCGSDGENACDTNCEKCWKRWKKTNVKKKTDNSLLQQAQEQEK